MNTSLIVKLNFFLLAFGLTAYLIYAVNTRGLSPGFLALFGIESSAPTQSHSLKKWTWCETRVTNLMQPGVFQLSQEGRNWIEERPEGQRVVDFIAVEKWFTRFCTLGIEPVEGRTSEDFKPVFMVKFVDGRTEILRQSSEGHFAWKGQVFLSSELLEAFQALHALPEGRRR